MVSTKTKWGIQVYSWGQNPSKFNLCFIKISVWILWGHLLLCLLTSQFNPIIQLSNCNLLLAVLFHCYITFSSCLLDLDICSIQTIASRYLQNLDDKIQIFAVSRQSLLLCHNNCCESINVHESSFCTASPWHHEHKYGQSHDKSQGLISLEIITTGDHLSHQLVTLRQGQGPLPSAHCCSNGCPERITLTRTF